MQLIFFLAAVLIVGALLFAVITMTKGGARGLDVDKYRSKWLEIEQNLARDDAASHQLSVLHADKLLDQALKDKGVAGNTMGERMKSAEKVWKNPNHIWGAHKIRNQLAHETDVKLNYETALRALTAFKQALKDLGAI